MRINKYIAQAGISSRRKADELVAAGQVKVNGAVMMEPGYDVKDGDVVMVQGQEIKPSTKKVYYAMNKPVRCVTTASDEEGRLTVLDVMGDLPERVFPVGRLDYNTSGLLFLTNDGDFAYHMTHPSSEIDKVYRVRVKGTTTKEKIARLRHGVDIGGYVTKRARVDLITWNGRSTILEITIHEGKNRQVRRMLEAVDLEVLELERVSIGPIALGRLKPGQFRKLNPSEVGHLMKL